LSDDSELKLQVTYRDRRFNGSNCGVPKSMAMQRQRRLRTGFTTGAAAAAAARGALIRLLEGKTPERVQIAFLTGETTRIDIASLVVENETTAVCTVIKDAGDDPDITHRAVIGARVTLAGGGGARVRIRGGVGVGTVTKPGLEVPVGEPAINAGPREMIEAEVRGVLARSGYAGSVRVEVFVPEGERLAQKTLNPRLGILGGLSILGTTGIERPMSHDAYIATIESSLSVARAAGLDHVVLTTGRRSERFAQMLWQDLTEETFIQIGDFFEASLTAAVEKGIETVTLTVFFGKAVKMAQGVPHTHAARSRLTLDRLSAWSLETTGDKDLAERVRKANTARHAFDLLKDDQAAVIHRVGRAMVAAAEAFAGRALGIRGVIFDYSGAPVFDSGPKGGSGI
jgi:cobalt-precorrin-5B (C1)-methyltransferase